MPSGNVVIKSRSKARCNDGSRYTLPEITYLMMLKRENK